ncbi:MAG TPA: rhodanese-like domain-containing protein [Ktedonobacterales bacterium]
MSNTSMKSCVLELFHMARQVERALVDGLSGAERAAVGRAEQWSPKDLVAHMAHWKQLQAGKLATAQRGETPPQWQDMELVNQINAEAFAQYQHCSWQELLDYADRAFAELVAAVNNLTEEELTDPNRSAWQDGNALWGETLANGAWHPFEHIMKFYRQQGDAQRAAAVLEQVLHMREMVVEMLRQIGASPETLGGEIYNLACLYALNDLPERALAILPEAFRLRPTLVEWSKHDTDLDSLRTHPTFLALYEEASLRGGRQPGDLISAGELHEKQRQAEGDRPVVIDVRGPKEYAAGHVRDAVNIPLSQLGKKLARVPQDRPVVTYCNMHHPGESRGERAAALLRKHGYQARALDGGYPGWKQAGLPVEEAVQA